MDEGRRGGGNEVREMLVGKNNTWKHSMESCRHTHTCACTHTHTTALLLHRIFSYNRKHGLQHTSEQNNKHAKPFHLRRTRSLFLSSSFSPTCKLVIFSLSLTQKQTNHEDTTTPNSVKGGIDRGRGCGG